MGDFRVQNVQEAPALRLYATCGREIAPCEAFAVLAGGEAVFSPDAGWGDFGAIFDGAQIEGGISPHGDALLSVWAAGRQTHIVQHPRFPLMGFEYKISGHEK